MPAINRGHYHEARFKIESGKYQTIRDEHGKPVRYATKKQAEDACKEAEISRRLLGTMAPAAPVQSTLPHFPVAVSPTADPGEQSFEDWVEEWAENQDLAETTNGNYTSHIECHLLPVFGRTPLKDITRKAIANWEKTLRDAGYADSSVASYRAVLHVILADAVEAKKISDNPAQRKRNRGRRTAQRLNRAPEKVITDAFGALLIAERTSLLSGRDDEFVAVILTFYTGLRFGELTGLQTECVSKHRLRVESKLAESKGKFIPGAPKGGSPRDIDLPEFLWHLISGFIARTSRQPCECHGSTHVFVGQAKTRSRHSASGVTQKMIAEHAGVTVSTVSLVLRGLPNVASSTRRRVLQAANELDYSAPLAGPVAAHWRRSGFYAWLYTPAVSGWYPQRGENFPARPVPVSSSEFPGVPVRGRNAHGRADSCWTAIAKGMTPHGNRHSHRTMLEELGTPQKLIDARIGHENSSMGSRYTHVTQAMVEQLMVDLTNVWNAALDKRLAMCSTSPVVILNDLLRIRQASRPKRLAIAA